MPIHGFVVSLGAHKFIFNYPFKKFISLTKGSKVFQVITYSVNKATIYDTSKWQFWKIYDIIDYPDNNLSFYDWEGHQELTKLS